MTMKVLLFLQIVVRVLFLNHLMNKAGKICMIGGFSVLLFWMDGRNIFTSPIYSAMLLLVMEIVFFIIDKRKFHAEDLFSCCVLESGIAVCNAAAIYVVSMILYNNLDYKLLHNNNLHIAWIVSLCMQGILLLVYKKWNRKQLHLPSVSYSVYSLLLIFLIIVLDCFEIALCTDEMTKSYLGICLYCFMIFSVVLIYWSIHLIQEEEKLKEQEILAELYKQNSISANQLLNTKKELLKIKHDLKHYVNALDDEATKEKYLNEINQDLIPVETGNTVLDVLLNHTKQQCKEKGITFSFVMTLSHTIKMEDSDLYLLISNLLDNAMQHVGSKKNIVLEISEVGNCLKIIERNSIDHNVLKDGEFIVSSAESHGYGWATIKQIVEKYHGEVMCEEIFECVEIRMLLWDCISS